MSKLYWEDFTTGRVFEGGPRRVTRDEIVEFATEFDPQPFHLDEDAARQTMFGGLAASGWHGCCILMRMTVDAFVGNSSSMGAPGVDEVKWLLPIRSGRPTLAPRHRARHSRSRRASPDRGFVKFLVRAMFNGSGARVLAMTTSMMYGRRNPGGVS